MDCPLCGAPDILWVEDLPARVVQQSEIKEVVVTREEHRAYAYWCEACEQIHYAEFPSAVPDAPTRAYGDRWLPLSL